jgi:AraC family transcriptional regulator of adaptative response/methylated-DNA-[protein]-cysteine methyltransferase
VSEHQTEQPDLQRLAGEVGVSPHHLQRTFQAWAGVSPKQFLKSLTRRAARARLMGGSSVLESAYASGLSGPGRLHDLMITTEALTPGEMRRRGEGVEIEFGFGESLFGDTLVAWTSRGINFLGFCQEQGREQAMSQLQQEWRNACFRENHHTAEQQLRQIFGGASEQPIRLWLRGSPFQLRVWEALLEVPESSHITYGRLADRIGQPGAARAVGGAIGCNPIAWLIPCHRVIREIGDLGGYRWGQVTKHAMIGYEACRKDGTLAVGEVYEH